MSNHFTGSTIPPIGLLVIGLWFRAGIELRHDRSAESLALGKLPTIAHEIIALSTPQPDRRFRAGERLSRRADIARVFAQKRSAQDDLMTVFVADNNLKWSRLAVSISKKQIALAVRRNRVRRRIRECYRQMKLRLPKGLDIVCLARGATVEVGCTEIGQSLEKLILKAEARSPRSEAGSKPRSDRRTEKK